MAGFIRAIYRPPRGNTGPVHGQKLGSLVHASAAAENFAGPSRPTAVTCRSHVPMSHDRGSACRRSRARDAISTRRRAVSDSALLTPRSRPRIPGGAVDLPARHSVMKYEPHTHLAIHRSSLREEVERWTVPRPVGRRDLLEAWRPRRRL